MFRRFQTYIVFVVGHVGSLVGSRRGVEGASRLSDRRFVCEAYTQGYASLFGESGVITDWSRQARRRS